MNTPFGQWSKEQVCGWLEDCGLAQYVNLTRQWVDSGQTLLSASPQDYEKVRKFVSKAFTVRYLNKKCFLFIAGTFFHVQQCYLLMNNN